MNRNITYNSFAGQLVNVVYKGLLGATPVQRPDAWPSAPTVGLQTAIRARHLLVLAMW